MPLTVKYSNYKSRNKLKGFFFIFPLLLPVKLVRNQKLSCMSEIRLLHSKLSNKIVFLRVNLAKILLEMFLDLPCKYL